MQNGSYLHRARSLFIVAIAMTWTAEIVYFIGWGVILFPGGNVLNKLVWTTVCGIGMGSVIGAALLVLVEGRPIGSNAFWLGAAIPFAVSSGCAILCGRIDMNFNYFGGAENPVQFVLSGVIPAAIGGLAFSWLFYLPSGQRTLARVFTV